MNRGHAGIVPWDEMGEHVRRSHPIVDGEDQEEGAEEQGEIFEEGFLHMRG